MLYFDWLDFSHRFRGNVSTRIEQSRALLRLQTCSSQVAKHQLRKLSTICFENISKMNNFKTGDTVEALDEFGVWAKGIIVAMDGEKLRVSFEGFGSMWNRSVSEEEIRPETIA